MIRHLVKRPAKSVAFHSAHPCASPFGRPAVVQIGNPADLSLHAGVAARADQRDKLERLCRYISRPAISEKRLSLTNKGLVRYQLKTPYRAGTTHVFFEPLDFLARLAALVPRPRVNLTRFHSVFAPNSKCRAQVTPGKRGKGRQGPGVDSEDKAPAEKHAAMTWAKRLKRVLLRASCPPPFGPVFDCSKSLLAIWSALMFRPAMPAAAPSRSLPPSKIRRPSGRSWIPWRITERCRRLTIGRQCVARHGSRDCRICKVSVQTLTVVLHRAAGVCSLWE